VRDPATDAVVVDASAIVEALLSTGAGSAARTRMRGVALHAPAHLDAEVLSTLGRLTRSGDIPADLTADLVDELAGAPILRHPLPALLRGAWARRDRHRLVDGLYVELAEALGSLPLVTTDARLARTCGSAELIVVADWSQPAPALVNPGEVAGDDRSPDHADHRSETPLLGMLGPCRMTRSRSTTN